MNDAGEAATIDKRRDLREYAGLTRLPVASYARKAAAPSERRTKTEPSFAPRFHRSPRFPSISAFSRGRFLDFVRSYLWNRIFGPRHSFETYGEGDPDQGVYAMDGDSDGRIRIALCGDWGTGTDEAHYVGQRIRRFDPHYTVHLGDVYYVGGPELTKFINRHVLWFWGHEHRLMIYKEFGLEGGLRAHGRCIGHGGMPVEYPLPAPVDEMCPVERMDDRLYFTNEDLRLGMNGFARLTLHGPTRAEYVDLRGDVFFCEDWKTEGGELKRVDTPAIEAVDG
jgi:hypothetical protein